MPHMTSVPPGPDHPIHLDSIPLESEQKALFCLLVEAFRSIPREEREEFYLLKSMDGATLIHSGLGKEGLDVYQGDLSAFVELGLMRLAHGSKGTQRYDPTPKGFRYYEHLKVRRSEGLQAVEQSIRTFVTSDQLRSRSALAYDAWSRAAGKFWSSDVEKSSTEIGHL